MLRLYGTATTIIIPLIDPATGRAATGLSFEAGDVKVIKDGGSAANITTLPTQVTNGKSVIVSLSAAEMQAGNITIELIDQTATAAWMDVCIDIVTYGNASANLDLARVSDIPTPEQNRQEMDNNSVKLESARVNAEILVTDDIPGKIASLNNFDPTTQTVTTDTDSRNASKADVSGVATSSALTAVANAVGNLPSAAQIRTEMDNYSTKLFSIGADTYSIALMVDSLNDISPVQAGAAVLDAATDDHDTAGTFGKLLIDSKSGIDTNIKYATADIRVVDEGGQLKQVLFEVGTETIIASKWIYGPSDAPLTSLLETAVYRIQESQIE